MLDHLCLTRREDHMPTAQDQSPATAGNSVRLLALATAQFVIAAFLGQFRCVVGLTTNYYYYYYYDDDEEDDDDDDDDDDDYYYYYFY